jgi:hypothetical protein
MFAAHGANRSLVVVCIFGAIIWYILRWIAAPKEEWQKLKPSTRTRIIDWSLLVLIFFLIVYLKRKSN